MQWLKKTLYVVVLIAVCVGVFHITKSYYAPKSYIVKDGAVEKTVKLSGKNLKFSLNNLGVLETAEYHYTHVETYDSDRIVMGFTVPLTNSKFVYSYDGVITAGIDFADIDVEKSENVIIVKLPKAEIQSSEIDEDSFKLYDEQNNIFNPIGVKDVNGSFANMKKYEENAAVEKGLFDWANNNAKVLIENFLKNAYYIEGYEIKFADN
ncbi:MAG: DUF4230 domain-containing protein [Candidatus Ornithomonoglobus sp.]